MTNEIAARLSEVEKRFKNFKRTVAGIIVLLLALLVWVGFIKSEKFDIVRAKGIVIEDSNGKDRILIGAPLPFSADRVRTDTALVRKYFATRVDPNKPERYMEYYKNYRHQAYGLVVMNEKGIDVVQFGDKLSDANTGRRTHDMSGMLWNDQYGLELGGVGVGTTEDGKGAPLLSFDDPSNGGSEALKFIVDDDGTKFINIIDKEGEFVFGFGKPKNRVFESNDSLDFVGIQFFDKSGKMIWEKSMKMVKN